MTKQGEMRTERKLSNEILLGTFRVAQKIGSVYFRLLFKIAAIFQRKFVAN